MGFLAPLQKKLFKIIKARPPQYIEHAIYHFNSALVNFFHTLYFGVV